MDYKARKAYQNKEVVETYDAKRFTTFKGQIVDKKEKSLVERALKYANINPPATIIDIPCGTGRVLVHLASKGFRIKGVDLSPETVSHAQQKAKRLHLEDNIAVEVGDAENLSYPDNSFDACISLRLFGHTPPDSRIRILQELRQITKRYLVLAYYTKNCVQYFLRRRRRKIRSIEWYPITHKRIEEELKMVGLEKVRYFRLLKGISETIIVLAKKIKDENSGN